MTSVDTLGAFAVLLSTLSVVPQIYKTWTTKTADDISYGWLIAALAGAALWLAYGSLKSDWAIVAANAAVSVFVAVLVVMKKAYAKESFRSISTRHEGRQSTDLG